jgi:hypothetical protein
MVLERWREKDSRLDAREEESRLQSREEESREESQLEARLKSLGATLAESLLASDTTALESLLDNGFVLRLPDGERILKEEVLELVANRQMRYDALLLELGGVHVYDGQVAFLSGYCHCDKFFRGRRLAGRFPFTALWVCRRGNWQIVAIHHLQADERGHTVAP